MTALLLDDVSTKLHLATAFTVQLGGHHGKSATTRPICRLFLGNGSYGVGYVICFPLQNDRNQSLPPTPTSSLQSTAFL